jgi:hypothetical protein
MKANKTRNDAPTNTYAAGDRVIVTLPDTEPLAGTIEQTTKTGWLIVALDPAAQDKLTAAGDKRMKDGKISVRSRSLTPLTLAIDPITAIDTMINLEEAKEAEQAEQAEQAEEEKAEHPMAKALREARVRYVKTKRPEGTSSADCGDALARTLRDLEPLEVAALADKVLGEAAGYHAGKYGHLNPGQIRMNSGNRIRAFLKTADLEGLGHAYVALGWANDIESGHEAEEEGDEEEGDDE